MVASRVAGTSASHRGVRRDVGLRLGALIWGVYWLPQEWFIYHTLLHEPLLLCALELVLLAIGSVVAGFVTVAAARALKRRPTV
jgi:hypothetical protein